MSGGLSALIVIQSGCLHTCQYVLSHHVSPIAPSAHLSAWIRTVIAITLAAVLSAASAAHALAAGPGEPPDAPSITLALPVGPSLASVQWTSGASTGDAPLSGYRVQLRVAGTSDFIDHVVTDGATTAALFALTPGTSYDARIVAVSEIGDSLPSATAAFTTEATSPIGAVTDLAATPGPGEVTLTWRLASAGTAPQAYVIAYRNVGGTWTQWFGDSVGESAVVTDLEVGTEYEFQVAGMAFVSSYYAYGQADTASAAPVALPNAPVAALETGVGEAHLSWSVPDGNGLDIDAYIIEQLVADAWETIDRIPATAGAGTSVVYRGLTSGETVTYRVSAETSAGAGAPSEAVSGVIASPAPNAPELPETGPVGAALTSMTGATLALLGAALLDVRGARGRQRRVDPAHR